MSDLEQIDWETVVDLAKRFGGLLLALLFALAARHRKKNQPDEELERAPAAEEAVGVPAIEPGDDAGKLAQQYSRGEGTSSLLSD